MDDTRFKQNALGKLDTIYSIKKSMDLWLILWAEKECPVQVGDEYPIWVNGDLKQYMIVTKVTAALVPTRRFIWKIEGVVNLGEYTELRTDTFEMEE